MMKKNEIFKYSNKNRTTELYINPMKVIGKNVIMKNYF